MLQANRLRVSEGQLITIAGKSAGRKVRCTPQSLPVFNALVGLAENGNHWARLVVQGIRGLSAGRLHMDNIYVKKETNMAYGRGVFYIVLPGVRATLEDCEDGTYTLQYLQADLAYLGLQEKNTKPGLWRVSAIEGRAPEFVPDGSVIRKDYRPVVIADRSIDPPTVVADSTRSELVKTDSTMKGMIQHAGFDLHYTPGEGGVVGLKSAKKALCSEQDKQLMESATLLANTMYRARAIPGVVWYADWGGSGVLTRALQILTRQQPGKFAQHRIVLNRPTTSSSLTASLAGQLEIELSEKRTGLTSRELVGNHLQTLPGVTGAAKAAAFGLSGAGAAFGVAGLGPTVAGIVGFAGALYFVGTTMISGAKALSPKKYK